MDAPHDDEATSRAIAACLPEGWRVTAIRCDDGVLTIACRDPSEREHVLEARRRSSGARAFVTGERLAFSYRAEGAATAQALADYRAALSRLAAREDDLAAFIDRAAARSTTSAAARPALATRRYVLWHETDLRWWAIAARAADRVGDVRRMLDEGDGDTRRPVQVHLYFETLCGQACQFCQLPAQRRAIGERAKNLLLVARHAAGVDLVSAGVLDAILGALGGRGDASGLTITGHDWARHPKLDAMLRRLEDERTVPISFIGPGTALADAALADRVSALPTLESVMLTLQSADTARHDRIVGAEGAGARVVHAIRNLRARGVRPLVSTVLTDDALAELPDLAAWAEREGIVLGLQAFIPDRGPADLDACLPCVDAMRAALQAAFERAPASIGALNRVPLCAIPRALRGRAASIGQSAERQQAIFPGPCEGCSLRSACPGVPMGYARRFGAVGLVAEP